MGPLNSASKVQQAAGLRELPTVATGTGESGQASFCQIDGEAKAQLLAWVAKHRSDFKPTIVRLAKAKKDLCRHSITPTLSLDATMPQNRLEAEASPRPTQNEYPIWYFFYGTLGDPQILKHHLNLADIPTLLPAHIEGCQARTWSGRYKALVEEGPQSARVSGSAFLVQNSAEEDALRFYETDKYEVVRCSIVTEKGMLKGLTFRFNGRQEELD